MKKVLVPVFLIVLSMFVSAQYYKITSHSIEIDIHEDGFAKITERFYLSFPNDFQLQKFRNKSQEIGVDLQSWKAFDGNIHTYIGNETEILSGTVSFEEETKKYLELNYLLSVPIMQKYEETTRVVKFRLNQSVFSQFDVGPVWVIQDGTKITFKLPLQAIIEQPVEPSAIISDNSVTWRGYKSTNVLNLRYIITKEIAPSFDISQEFQRIMLNKEGLILIVIVLIVAGVIYWKRKTISDKIENYIVEHSEFTPEEEEELD